MWLLLALVAGSLVYCVLVIVAARRYLSARPSALKRMMPITILKPLAGADEGLAENLRSFFTLDYPDFEILLAVRHREDPAVAIAESLRLEFAGVRSKLLIVGEPPYANAKVFSLDCMMAAAANDVLVMSDSDIRVAPDMLRIVAAEFQDPKLGVATCPYRAIAGRSFWSQLEAAGMNTEFLGGVLVARMLEGMKFAVGPTIVARKQALREIGGFDRLKDYLAEDFVMGKFADDAGWKVTLSSYVVEHRIGTETLAANAAHRLRWARSTRRSRPAGYVGQLFTNPLPLAALLVLFRPEWWPLLAVTVAIRTAAAYATAVSILHSNPRWWLIPLQDLLSFVFWIAGFFGNTIIWRGKKYYLQADGRFVLVA
ncbi:MAG: bacteriohopanetetrol glucosamine biosynthesis glycosyltransferase HpnI [Bryobacteraceae bacterium]